MKIFPPDLWITIECSLAYVEESKRLIEQAIHIRARSKDLRRDSAALIRSKLIARGESYLPDYSNTKPVK